jgi:hypothetical protein
MMPDAVLVESCPVFVLVEIVGPGQFGKETTPIHCQRPAGQHLLDGGTDPCRCAPRNSTQDSLAVLTEIRAEQRQQFDDELIGDLTRELSARTTAGAPTPVSRQTQPLLLQEGAFGFDFFRRQCRLLIAEPAIGCGAGGDQTVVQPDPQRITSRCTREDDCVEPVAQDVLNVLAPPPGFLLVEQQGDERLDCDGPHQTRVVMQPLVLETNESP